MPVHAYAPLLSVSGAHHVKPHDGHMHFCLHDDPLCSDAHGCQLWCMLQCLAYMHDACEGCNGAALHRLYE